MINQSKRLAGPFIVELNNKFKDIAGVDNQIDKIEFINAITGINSEVASNIFDIFDLNKNGFLDKNEFMDGIKMLLNGDEEDLIDFAFKIHDTNKSGFIEKNELKILLIDILTQNSIDFDQYQIDLLTNQFFLIADINHDGKISHGEFYRIVDKHPDFKKSLAVNPISWFSNDSFRNSDMSDQDAIALTNDSKKFTIQVDNIGLLSWLLVPKLVFFYNIFLKRRNNSKEVKIIKINLLPSKNISLVIKKPNSFNYIAGDYLYVNLPFVSRYEWYPFIISPSKSPALIKVNIKSYGKWAMTFLKDIENNVNNYEENRKYLARIDGPYGSSSNFILNNKNIILVGSGKGVSKIASILQDIVLKKTNEPSSGLIENITFIWLSDNDFYLEWLKKVLVKIDESHIFKTFDYNIYFTSRKPSQIPDRMLYIENDILSNSSNIDLLNMNNLKLFAGYPEWDKIIEIITNKNSSNFKLFLSGKIKNEKFLKSACKSHAIEFKKL